MTIIGFEKQRNGARNLLVFDPMFRDSTHITKLTNRRFKCKYPDTALKAYRRGNKYLQKYREFETLRCAAPVSVGRGSQTADRERHTVYARRRGGSSRCDFHEARRSAAWDRLDKARREAERVILSNIALPNRNHIKTSFPWQTIPATLPGHGLCERSCSSLPYPSRRTYRVRIQGDVKSAERHLCTTCCLRQGRPSRQQTHVLPAYSKMGSHPGREAREPTSTNWIPGMRAGPGPSYRTCSDPSAARSCPR